MKKVIWVLFDDRTGSVGQAKGILQFLNKEKYDVVEKKIVYNKWARLPNLLKINKLLGLNVEASDSLRGPYPDAVLSISRRTAPIARFIKQKSNNKCKIVQLMKLEKWEAKKCDLLVISKHDEKKLKLPQAVYITGCTHRITSERLLEEKEKWQPIFSHLPRPFTSVIVGGSIKGKPFSIENARTFGKEIRKIWQENGGSLLITSSRRTGKLAEKAIMDELNGIPMYTFLWGDTKENPYMGYMACADMIVVSGDSVSMCSESCGTQKPVLIFRGEDWLTPKHLSFCQTFFEAGYACPIEDKNASAFKPKEYKNPSMEVAQKIEKIV